MGFKRSLFLFVAFSFLTLKSFGISGNGTEVGNGRTVNRAEFAESLADNQAVTWTCYTRVNQESSGFYGTALASRDDAATKALRECQDAHPDNQEACFATGCAYSLTE